MKCFERLIMRHIKTLLPPSLDPLQFAYRPNHSTDDAITTTLHLALAHLNKKDTYVRMLFIGFSSAFNTIIPQHLIGKLNLLGLNTSLRNWILFFLTGRPQSVRIMNSTTLSTGAPQGCVLRPLLFTLLTHDCVATHSSNHFIKFADDTTVVGLNSKNDESAYREEVQRLTDWCRANNLSLNVDKTKEMVKQNDHSPLNTGSSSMEIIKSTKFLGVHLAEKLTCFLNTSSITKKAQQRLYFLRRLRKSHLPPPILTMFYRGTIVSILSSCIAAWFGICTVSGYHKTLQRIVRTAEKIIRITPGSKAASGNLTQGDIIVAIDGVSTEGMTHLEAQNKIKSANFNLALTMQKSKRPIPVSMTAPRIDTSIPVIPHQKVITNMPINNEYVPSFNPIALKDTALSTNKPIEVKGPGGKATIIHAQYNTPISMYSQDAIMDAIAGQSQARGAELSGDEALSGSPLSSLPVKERVIDSASPVYQAVNSSGEVLEPAEWARRAAHMQSKSFRLLAHLTGTEYLQDPDEEALTRAREIFESGAKGPRFAKLKNWHNGLSAQILNLAH
ncbi:hypothetical protein PDJAM_G00183670 [Pangasius djambal]|uniref:Uncharacterized protein n=1 Tax=Pangasius djambal TaxID=1691987 RepID=A0ACC5Y454_9TELE|nr:hypothetical protein [Pangasius djambal]